MKKRVWVSLISMIFAITVLSGCRKHEEVAVTVPETSAQTLPAETKRL